MQTEFVPRAQRDHNGHGHEAARFWFDARPRPDFAPRLTGDLLLDFGVEVVAVRKRTVDPDITKHLAPNFHAVLVAVPGHGDLLLQVVVTDDSRISASAYRPRTQAGCILLSLGLG